jgi:protocatechuate 3,4-dioxygenase beta subunit
MKSSANDHILTRRGVLSLIAVTAVGGTMMPRLAFAQSAGAADAELLLDTDVCAIVPETAEGPYYFDPRLERIDITEGRPGVPLQLRLQAVDASCRPLPGARIDVWHADATGLYSGYVNRTDDGAVSAEGETFMRGTQFADDAGIVTFDTVYPGWYPGRTTHVHFKVFVDETNLLTGQIFFPDELSDRIYSAIAPYNERSAARDTRNGSDGIAQRAGPASMATVGELAGAYAAALIIGIDPGAV